jgi:hypothetical protein
MLQEFTVLQVDGRPNTICFPRLWRSAPLQTPRCSVSFSSSVVHFRKPLDHRNLHPPPITSVYRVCQILSVHNENHDYLRTRAGKRKVFGNNIWDIRRKIKPELYFSSYNNTNKCAYFLVLLCESKYPFNIRMWDMLRTLITSVCALTRDTMFS